MDQNNEPVSQLVKTVQAIDWTSIQDDPESMDLLSSIKLRLDHMAELVDQWKYEPITLTSRYEQLEKDMAIKKPRRAGLDAARIDHLRPNGAMHLEVFGIRTASLFD